MGERIRYFVAVYATVGDSRGRLHAQPQSCAGSSDIQRLCGKHVRRWEACTFPFEFRCWGAVFVRDAETGVGDEGPEIHDECKTCGNTKLWRMVKLGRRRFHVCFVIGGIRA